MYLNQRLNSLVARFVKLLVGILPSVSNWIEIQVYPFFCSSPHGKFIKYPAKKNTKKSDSRKSPMFKTWNFVSISGIPDNFS